MGSGDSVVDSKANTDSRSQLGRFLKRPAVVFSVAVIGVLILFSLIPISWLPYNPATTSGARFTVPVFFEGGTVEHLLGTDSIGRDIFSNLVAGTRYTMLIAVVSALIGLVIGVSAGLVAGFYGGIRETIIMRLADIQLAFPVLILLIAITAAVGSSIPTLIAVLGLTSWAPYARLVRGSVLSIKEKEYVEAAHATGISDSRLIFRHILPNAATAIIVFLTFQFAQLVLLEAALSFLGLGVQPPAPSWGRMVADSRQYIYDAWWASALPGVLTVLCVLAFSLLGDELRDLFGHEDLDIA